MIISACPNYDDCTFSSIKEMPVVLIQELEIYFRIDATGIERCLEEGMSIREIKDLCRALGKSPPTIH